MLFVFKWIPFSADDRIFFLPQKWEELRSTRLEGWMDIEEHKKGCRLSCMVFGCAIYIKHTQKYIHVFSWWPQAALAKNLRDYTLPSLGIKWRMVRKFPFNQLWGFLKIQTKQPRKAESVPLLLEKSKQRCNHPMCFYLWAQGDLDTFGLWSVDSSKGAVRAMFQCMQSVRTYCMLIRFQSDKWERMATKLLKWFWIWWRHQWHFV